MQGEPVDASGSPRTPATAPEPDPRSARVRSLTAADLPFAAGLHVAALPHGFFARLGERFLGRYYAGYLASPHAVALLAELPGPPASRVGVLVGTLDTGLHNRWVLRHHGLRLALAGALALLARPRELRLFLRTRLLRYLRAVARARRTSPAAAARPVPAAAAPVGGTPAVLTHVAVSAAGRGRGAGQALVHEFVGAARAAGRREAQLVTLAEPGSGAGAFYERLGWTAVRERADHDGRRVRLYRTEV